MKRISIFGSTGSVGQKMIDVVSKNPSNFEVVCLSCNKNVKTLMEQAKKLRPKHVVISDSESYKKLKNEMPNALPAEELNNVAQIDVDIVGMAISGSPGIEPSFNCLGHAKTLAIANKETIVSGGDFFISQAKKLGTKIIPVDSEHSAIYQCLLQEEASSIHQIILTCSGGPFVDYSKDMLNKITVHEALRHPTWKMGKKISVDSATFINKALELIEAAFLFSFDIRKIRAVIHRQSIVHGMVCFNDRSVKAMLSEPDMMIPVKYALNDGLRTENDINDFKFVNLSFEDFKDWQERSINFAYSAHREKKCIAFNSANEKAVYDFLKNRIKFTDIQDSIERALANAEPESIDSVDDIMQRINS